MKPRKKGNKKMTITLNWRMALQGVGVALLLVLLGSGVYTHYHFFLKATGVTFQESGEELSRAQLIDMVLERSVTQPAQPAVAEVEPEGE